MELLCSKKYLVFPVREGAPERRVRFFVEGQPVYDEQCETIIAFKPGDDVELVKLLKYNVKDERARKAISNIGRYFCITKGWLATDKCRIDYPLILDIPE